MNESHCAGIVRDHDKDRFLASLFAPDDKREKLFALYAFNAEVSRIAQLVSEPHLGLIRQQWWHDTLDAGTSGHPVAQALLATGLPVAPLKQLIAAHEFDLFDNAMPGLDALETYLGQSSSILIQLAAILLDKNTAPKVAECAGLAGVAYGLARVLATGQSKFIPAGMTRQSLAAHAMQRLAQAREAGRNLPPALLPAFLPVALTPLYLKRQPPSQFRRQVTLWWAARRERF